MVNHVTLTDMNFSNAIQVKHVLEETQIIAVNQNSFKNSFKHWDTLKSDVDIALLGIIDL
jgi:hypothetical protein